MKKILFVFLFLPFLVKSQPYTPTAPPSNYTGINFQIYYRGMIVDRLGLPTFNTTPSIRTGQFNGAGAVGVDTVNHQVWFYSGGTWRQLSSGGSVAGNTSYIQLNRNGSFAAAASDTLTYTTSGGLNIKNIVTNLGLGVGTTSIAASAIADFTSTTKGILIPRLTTTQQNAVSSPATGLLIFNTDSSKFRFYDGAAWTTLAGGGGGGGGSQNLSYNSGTHAIDITSGTSAVIPLANTTTTGLITSTDWNTFNNKVSSQWTTTGSAIYYNNPAGVGNTGPVASAILELTSTTKGFLAPRMNTTQQNAIGTPATGLLIYNTDSSMFRFYNGAAWVSISTGGGGGGAASTKFGKSAEDATAAETRAFNGNNFDFSVDSVKTLQFTTKRTGTDSLRIRTSIIHLDTLQGSSNPNDSIVVWDNDKKRLGKKQVDYVNIKNFGAIADGTTDNSDAIADAIATGRTVFIPEGNFAFASALTLQKGQMMFGLGRKSHLKYTGSLRAITVDTGSIVSNFWLQGSGKASGNQFETGILCYQTIMWRIENMYITQFGGNPSPNGGGGIVITLLGSGNTEGGHVLNTYIDSCKAAMDIETRGEYIVLTNCTFTNSDYGFALSAGNVYASNCNVQKNTYGLYMVDGTNDGHGSLSGIAFNHNTYNQIQDADLSMYISNCGIYYGGLIIKNSNNIRFVNCDMSTLDSFHLENNTNLYRIGCMIGKTLSLAEIPGQSPPFSGQAFNDVACMNEQSYSDSRYFLNQQNNLDSSVLSNVRIKYGLHPSSSSSDSVIVKTGVGVLKTVAQSDIVTNVPSQELKFIVGVTTNAPVDGDTIFVYPSFSGKKLDVYRDGHLQTDSVLLSGIFFKTDTIHFYPALVDSEKIIIHAFPASNWTYLPVLSPFDADAQTYFDAVIAAGGTLSTPAKTAYSNWVTSEKSNGTYSKYSVILPMMGGTAAAHAINAKSPGTNDITFTGSWTHDASGADPDGADGTYATTVAPNTQSQNSIEISTYTNQTGNGYMMGVYNLGASVSMAVLSGTTTYTNCNSGADNNYTQSATGYYMVTRTASGNYDVVVNGTAQNYTQSSAAPISTAMRIGNLGAPPGSGLGTVRRIAFATVGSGFTTTEAGNCATYMTTLQTALGRN